MPSRRIPTIGPKRTTADALKDVEMRAGKAGRVVSISEMERLTGFDRGTITRMIGKGLVPERKGAKGAIMVDVRALIDFREEQARIDERKKFATVEEETGSDGDLDAELKREQIVFQKVKTAERVGLLVPSDVVEMSQGMLINAFRTSVDGLADRVIRECLQGFEADVTRKVKTEIQDTCRAALMMAQATADRDFRRFTRERLGELGADLDEEFDLDGDEEETEDGK